MLANKLVTRKNFKGFRKKMKWSQREMAKRLVISHQMVHYIETNKRKIQQEVSDNVELLMEARGYVPV